MAYDYGTGTANQFTDGSQRQVLELGKLIHMYNPSVTPMLTISSRVGTNVTPVPIFEWMEDELMIKKSTTQDIKSQGADSATVDVTDSASGGVNGHNVIVKFDRQAQMEMFEVGGIYSASVAGGSAALGTDVTHFICIAIGQNVNLTSPTDTHVQFVGAHAHASLSAYNTEAMADGTDLITIDASGVLTLTYVGTAGLFYDNGTATSYYGYHTSSGSSNFGEANFADADYFTTDGGPGTYAEGAGVGKETRKRVRRLKNCTQIFREPYTITGTAQAAKHYGGSELDRLRARKLAKIKSDIEWSMLTNGAIALDATSENPKRTFEGFGVGQSNAGVVSSLDGQANSDLQLNFSSGTLDNFDSIVEVMFHDLIGGSDKKTVFASNKWMKKLTSMVRAADAGVGEYNIGTDVTAGLRVREYYGPVGALEFIAHPMLNGVYEDYALAVDFSNFDFRPLAERNLQLRSDIVQDGSDGRTDEWLIECGPEIRNEQTHAIMKLV